MLMQAALSLHGLGYVITSVKLQATDDGGKRPFFMKGWQQAQHDDCIDRFFDPGHNALAILTGKGSDLLVVDCDVLKPKDSEEGVLDGVEVMQRAFHMHNEKEDKFMSAVTGNKGRHFYFSLSKSIASGLRLTTNTSKLVVCHDKLQKLGFQVDKPSMTTIDVRGEGGCCFCAPTSYSGKEYRWESKPCRSRDLQACPLWLIDWLNASSVARGDRNKRRNTQASGDAPGTSRQRLDLTAPSTDRAAADQHDEAMIQRIKALLEGHFGNKIAHWYDRPYGGDFHVEDRNRDCSICSHVHHSNSYQVRVVIPPCVIVRNYSSRCAQTVLGWKEVPAINNLIFNPQSDYAFVDLFVAGQKYRGFRWMWFDAERTFLKYDGVIWKPEVNMDVGQAAVTFSTYVLEQIIVFLASVKAKTDMSKNKDEEITNAYKGLVKAYQYIQRANAVDAVIRMAKYRLHDSSIAKKMDMDPNLLGCQNGVIDLRTGALITDDPEVFVSKQCEVEYKGLDFGTPDVDAFLSSIFNGDVEVIGYMQRLLGYGMTGLCREEVFVVFTGSGGNGKSLLNKLIKGVMGPYWNTMSRDCVFKSERHTNPGGPSPHLAMLRGLRISVLDDCSEQESLDDGTIKKMTSGVPIDARMLNQNPIVFTPTHLPIICTNHLPKINVDDEAIERRLVLVPFANNYRPADKYDPNDPTHRPIDMKLGEKLSTPEVLEQFLAWMVKGAVAWYEHGLGIKPTLLAGAQSSYYEEHDVLTKFINDHCVVSSDKIVSSTIFKTRFEEVTQQPARDLKQKMQKRGFKWGNRRISGNNLKAYIGLDICM